MYQVVEQRFTDSGYEFVPVSAPRKTVQQAECDQAVLERRFREQELEARYDYAHLETCFPFKSKLEHLGQRYRTRLFAVRKGENQ